MQVQNGIETILGGRVNGPVESLKAVRLVKQGIEERYPHMVKSGRPYSAEI